MNNKTIIITLTTAGQLLKKVSMKKKIEKKLILKHIIACWTKQFRTNILQKWELGKDR